MRILVLGGMALEETRIEENSGPRIPSSLKTGMMTGLKQKQVGSGNELAVNLTGMRGTFRGEAKSD